MNHMVLIFMWSLSWYRDLYLMILKILDMKKKCITWFWFSMNVKLHDLGVKSQSFSRVVQVLRILFTIQKLTKISECIWSENINSGVKLKILYLLGSQVQVSENWHNTKSKFWSQQILCFDERTTLWKSHVKMLKIESQVSVWVIHSESLPQRWSKLQNYHITTVMFQYFYLICMYDVNKNSVVNIKYV